MKSILILFLTFTSTFLFSQKVGINNNSPQEALDVNGKIRVSNDNNSQSPAGTIRFNPETQDFEGYDGSDWRSFTPDPSDFYWPRPGEQGTTSAYFPYSPGDAVQGEGFGTAVDISGNVAVIGSPNYANDKGRVHILRRSPDNRWILEQILLSPNIQAGELFGCSVAISGSRIVIGAKGHKVNTFPYGAIYIYEFSGGSWNLTHQDISNDICYFNYGYDVDIQDNILIASSPNPSLFCTNNDGVVRISEIFPNYLSSSYIVPTFPAPAPPLYQNNVFGHSIAISNGWVVVSAPFSSSQVNIDSVYIYQKTSSPITYEHKQTLSTFKYDNQFGHSVAIHNGTMMIGEPYDDHATSTDNRGSAYIYELDNTNSWCQKLIIAGRDSTARFGYAVGISNQYQMAAARSSVSTPSPENITLKKNLSTFGFELYTSILDPGATLTPELIQEVSIDNNSFIIGIPNGVSVNGQLGGRIFLGKVR